MHKFFKVFVIFTVAQAVASIIFDDDYPVNDESSPSEFQEPDYESSGGEPSSGSPQNATGTQGNKHGQRDPPGDKENPQEDPSSDKLDAGLGKDAQPLPTLNGNFSRELQVRLQQLLTSMDTQAESLQASHQTLSSQLSVIHQAVSPILDKMQSLLENTLLQKTLSYKKL